MNRPMGEQRTDERAAGVLARRLWQVVEPLHAVTYFAPETRAATDALGLKGGWMSYFGCRAAPLGPVGPAVVTAAFYNFHPAMVARAIPDAWTYSAPQDLLGARLEAVDRAYRRLFGDDLDAPAWREAAGLVAEAADGCDVAGRPLAAANAALDLPDRPHLRTWQCATILREHRGDGHVAALVHAGVGPAEALVLQGASGRSPRDGLQAHRGWSVDEWAAAEARAIDDGWLTADGRLTPEGAARRERVEADTDRLARRPVEHLGLERTAELVAVLRPLAQRVMEQGEVPRANLMGVPWPPSAGDGA